MNVNIISIYNELLELEKDWEYIFEKSGTNNIFTSWEWCSLWWKHYGKNQKLLVLVIKDGAEIIGIAPLMVSKGNYSTLWRPVVSFWGGELADYMDFLILRDNKEVISVIINFFMKHDDWGMIDFKRIPESSPNLIPIRECAAGLKYPYNFRVSCVSPIVKIKKDWDDYYKSISKGLRQDIRTGYNKFKLTGDIEFETYNIPSPKALLDDLFELHRKRQDYKLGQSLFELQDNLGFFYDLAFAFSRIGWADISVLKTTNRIVSAVFALKYKGIFYYWIPVFAPEFIKYSPGKIHIHALLKNCFEQNYEIFDFMRGDEEYKFKWANHISNNYEFKIYSNGLYRKLDALRSLLRKYIKIFYYKYPVVKRVLIKISKIKPGRFIAKWI